MGKHSKPKNISLFLLLLVFFASPTSSQQPQINVWPYPRTVHWPTPRATLLSPTFQIISPSHKYLLAAVDRYIHLILSEHYQPIRGPPANLTNLPPLQVLKIYVLDLSVPLQHGVDESYELSIPTYGEANLTAATVWGAMRGLETFSQLVWYGGSMRTPVGLYIWDSPLFPHRGLMLDTSRNFYGVKDIMRTISAMSMNKMNVFHWHITDSHSFPIVLPSEPELAAKGSYGPNMQYSAEDVASIVEFGTQNGVRVMPEFDAPGHTGSWAEAYPEIVTCADMFWLPGNQWPDRLAVEPGTGHLNPLHPTTYQVLKNVIRDASSLFPEPFYHAGADEVVTNCWMKDASIQKFIKDDGGTHAQLLQTFINTTHPFIVSLNKTVVYWEDVLLSDAVKVDPSFLPTETTILQTWNNGPNNTKRVVSAGYRAIVSSSDFYYLDCGHGDFVSNDSRYDKQTGDDPEQPFNYKGGSGGSWCGPFKTWQRVYDYDITYGLTEEEAKLVIGGEVSLWSEQADWTVLDARVWPRTSAMAETMWSGNRDETGKKRYAEATDRLNEWRYRMVGRGIGAEPIQPLWCLTRPGMCNMVH